METKQEAVEHSHKHTNITKKRGVNKKKKQLKTNPRAKALCSGNNVIL